ncbi:hypothetical protein GCM10022246_26200 [Pedobacter ginsengiterrae]|uniref:HNH endonuclease n=1 Tax=Pedobacter ginsengiterrae TaxID=871696 RepID=A0ABP7PWS0_9SPHI
MPLNDNDKVLITEAIAAGGDVWANDSIKPVKDKIKAYYRGISGGHCCYCKSSFRGGFNMVIDIEHVLPKSKYADFIFELFNLNISCKRCNMLIKKDRLDFLLDEHMVQQDPRNTDKYLLIHPNLDEYFEHMSLDVVIRNQKEMVKFSPIKPKGQFTYDFFRLSELEVNSLNSAQGIGQKSEPLSVNLPQDMQDVANDLIRQL